jgi:uncharacterized membrane protein
MKFKRRVYINAPVEKVWMLVDNLEGLPQWMPPTEKIERVSKGPLTVGSRLSVTVR